VVRRDDAAAAVARLLDDGLCRRAMGRAGRRYAERAFSPETAADCFVGVFNDLAPGSAPDASRTPDSVSDSVPDGRPVTGRRTVRDQGMSWSDPKLITTTTSSTMGDVAADDKVTASRPFPHHVG
jgi:hypothetical protein